MKRSLDVGITQNRPRLSPAIVPTAGAGSQVPTLSNFSYELRCRVIQHLLTPEYSEQACSRVPVHFLRMTAVCKDWRRVLVDYIHAPDSAWAFSELFGATWSRSVEEKWTPVQWRDRMLQSFSFLTLRPDIASLRQHPTPPAVIELHSVEAYQLCNLGLPLDWGGRLQGTLLVNTGAEMNVFLDWLQDRDCCLHLELDYSSTAHSLSTHDIKRWRTSFAKPQMWRGDISIDFPQWTIPLGQAVQQADWKLSWHNGDFRLSHGDEERAAMHHMAWTRDQNEFIGARLKGDASRPAQRTRCIRFANVVTFKTEVKNLGFHHVRWNQHETAAGVSPAMLSQPGLTDLSLVFSRKDLEAYYCDSDEEAELNGANPHPPAPEYLKAIARAGTLQRLLLQVGDDWENDSQAESGGLLNLVFRGNPGLQAVCLTQMSDPMMSAPELYEELAGLTQLRQLSFIDADCLPPVECMHALLNALPGLEELRVFLASDLSDEKWVHDLAPILAAHPGLKLIEFNSAAIFTLQSTIKEKNIRRWKDLELYDGESVMVIQARSAQQT